MVDSLLFASLLDALKPETYLILIGDADQLPPVGAGNVLADMIESGRFGVARLEKIFRQAQESLIITNAHRINAGELPVLDVKDNDFFFLRTSAAAQTRELLVSLCRDRLPKSYGVSPEDDIQIISPTRKGELGTFELNRHLQQALNPPTGKSARKNTARSCSARGTKIMQTRNNYDVEWHKDGTQGSGVFNGDMGRILKIAPGGERMTLSFDGRIAEYDAALLEDVEHAYAVTVHKSQGSEYPMVLIPVFACPYPLMTRNLLYTAVTRAKDMVILAGSTDCIRTMVRQRPQGASLHPSAAYAGEVSAVAAEYTLFDKLLGLLAPQKCLYCGYPTDENGKAVCESCKKLEKELLCAVCPVCGLPGGECLCIEKDNITYLFWYDKKPVRRAVSRIKHGNNIVAARHIAALLAERMEKYSFDAVFYVPRSKKALRQYGFDQAALLAKCLSDELNVPVCPALCRSREKPPQKLLSAAQRRRNIRDSFTVKAGILGDAQNALLVDDVVTTGATVDECAALLRKAGVKTVHIACIAKTPNYFLH